MDLKQILKTAIAAGASDIHLVADHVPTARIHTAMTPMSDFGVISPEEALQMFREMANDHQLAHFEKTKDVDFSYHVPGLCRFRVNVHMQRRSVGISMRSIKEKIPPLAHLNLPEVIARLTYLPRGLVLVTGDTGSGKSTTLAAFCGVLTLSAPLAQGDELQLTGVVRDFMRGDQAGGHPDFETASASGKSGHVTGMVSMFLGADGKPVYNSSRPLKDSMYSADAFDQWYNDVPSVNLSEPLTFTLSNGESSPGGVYSYTSTSFFPVDGHLFGNEGLSNNYHFTLELHTAFTYRPNQQFNFGGDDDVWVYINDARVVDLGGTHMPMAGTVRLLDGKAFIQNNQFTLGGPVLAVTNSMKNTLDGKWANLGLPGTCPIAAGDYYIDLDLNSGGPDTRVEFSGTSVHVFSAQDLSHVVLQFEDGSEQKFDDLNVGPDSTFSGDGPYAGKTIIGCWVKSASNGATGDPDGQYHHSNGSTSINCTLDFFFAERHTSGSTFHIETTMLLESVDPATTSPMYD